MSDLRHGDWRTVLAAVEVDAVISDPPYSSRVHEQTVQREDGHSSSGLTPGYDAWTADHVHEFVRSWSSRTRGWMACMTSHDLIPAWEAAYAEAGRYCFAPVTALIPGMSVRMLGDGPSSWTIYVMTARPREKAFMSWGTLDGGYACKPSREAGGGRGKPHELVQALVRDYSRKGDLVCDPFSGWATCAEACEALGRRFVGSEQNADAYAEAQRRLSRMQQIDMFGGAA